MQDSQPLKEHWCDGRSRCLAPNMDVLSVCAGQNIVLMGESHDRPDHHQWQLAISEALYAIRTELALGFEMFPKRLQPVLDDWIRGSLNEQDFLDKTDWKKIWGFDPELYLPLFRFCKSNHLPMIALNCERPLVSEIGKLGWEGVEKSRWEGMTPSKPASSTYRQYLFETTGGVREGRDSTSAADPRFDRFVRAQQVWDRAFACNLAAFHWRSPDTLLIGIIGRGHLDYFGGTPYQLDDLGITNHKTLLPSDGSDFPLGIGDYIYCLET